MTSEKDYDKKSPIVIFDIGSASVGVAVVLISGKDKIPEIIYNTRTSIVSKNINNYERLFLAMLSAFKNTVLDLEQDGIRKLSRIGISVSNIENFFCVLSSTWYVSDIEILKFKKEKHFTVLEQSVLDILENSDDNFLKSSEKQFREKNIANPELIERSIIQILLNGYNVSKPYGKKVNNIDITLFISMISAEMSKSIKDILQRAFNIDNVSFHTFALSSFSVVRDIFNIEKDFLLMDISGEATDIILVRNEAMIKNMSFPLGKNFLIKKIADGLNTIDEEAYSLIRLFLEGKSAGSEMIKMEKVLMNIREEWLNSFRKILLDFSDGLFLPKTIFLTIDADIGKWFIDTIKNDEFSIYTLAEQPFNVVDLNSRILNEYCSVLREDKDAIGNDPFLIIEAVFAKKIANK